MNNIDSITTGSTSPALVKTTVCRIKGVKPPLSYRERVRRQRNTSSSFIGEPGIISVRALSHARTPYTEQTSVGGSVRNYSPADSNKESMMMMPLQRFQRPLTVGCSARCALLLPNKRDLVSAAPTFTGSNDDELRSSDPAATGHVHDVRPAVRNALVVGGGVAG